MNYLDLNLTHLNSINPHELKRWNVIWRWSTWIITTIWATWTGLQLILKETSRPEWEERSFFFQLSLLKALYEYLPAYRDSLPQVFWLLRRNKGKVLWIMMERFDGINIKNFSPQDEEVANFQNMLGYNTELKLDKVFTASTIEKEFDYLKLLLLFSLLLENTLILFICLIFLLITFLVCTCTRPFEKHFI